MIRSLFILALFTVLTHAKTVNFVWDITPTATRYDIYKINPATNKGEWFGWTSTESFFGDFPIGTHQIAVIASNKYGYAPASDNLEFLVEPDAPSFTLSGDILTTTAPTTLRLTVQFSPDLKYWSDKPSPKVRFYRVKVESR